MESFTIELVSNPSEQLFPDNIVNSFTNYLAEQLNLEDQGEVAISEKTYPSRFQNVTEGNIMFFLRKLLKSSDIYYLELGLYPSITDIAEAMNTLIQERHNHSENCIKVNVPRRTQNFETYLANQRSGVAILSRDLGHIFDGNVGNELGVMLRGKGPHRTECAYDIVRIHSLIIYTDLIEYKIAGDTKVPLLRCFPFISKFLSFQKIKIVQRHFNYWTIHEPSDI